MRPQTAAAIRLAGQALRAAITEARGDLEAPPQLRTVLGDPALWRLAQRLEDVPTPPTVPMVADPMHGAAARCDSCGVGRIITPLSSLTCPACGVVSEVTPVGT